ncbi:alkaline phosphatase [Dysgonomonas sp. PFB1-18]|uniref:alkaline phosphatase n=1 Tax=unclassified Dysgonomonas TaxID=2630389 RepID=UPI002475C8D9|nr:MULTISPECIES: alkaline phosphatase [unclassified Dysgonomonas]MDH6307937.1 alkaline phosphatase [Dysgonomonas sp. PF1-14]MDH6337855.1 alkaline phosphatase [Dysgonomonas sp. PF1-16]MDH6379079.1 alkaline phosphatase [Dysgonomonas sp. PFB1-18]MDH6396714.1 alkaline phosphatase [Dysgonomonas sp. PF1-23]
MKKINLSVLLIFVFATTAWAQQQYRKPVKPTKNVIVMIPDGTSIGVVSAARWYQIYNKLGSDNLAIDPYLCGTVKTFSSNAPIGDSAPTTSAYMTGMPQQTGNVAIYPVADPENDLIPVDPEMAYQPLATILEAMRYQQNKATGLVVTVEFPHATPADCSAHYYARGKYEYIAPQMAYQNFDVMFGGGNSILTDDIKQHFKNTGTSLIQNDIKAFRNFNGKEKIWALFGDRELPYDLDRDPEVVPSLAEMTQKALDRLSQNENGFFLMVEGSKIDWSAHGNDAIGCITEYLAFDKAVGAVMDYAKKDGNTTVIVLPDHGNSGFTIGRRDLKRYDRASIDKLFKNVSQYKKTGEGLERILLKSKPEDFKSVFKEYTNIDLTEEELNLLLSSKNYHEADYMKVSNSVNMGSSIVSIMNSHTYFGFTTGGHTGEEVFLAAYHPNGDVPMGMNTNIEINQYLHDVAGLKMSLQDMTKEIFAKHTDVFKGMEYTIDKSTDFPVLKVKKGNKTLAIPAFKSVAYLNDQPITLRSVTVYIDKNDTFYIPRELADKL